MKFLRILFEGTHTAIEAVKAGKESLWREALINPEYITAIRDSEDDYRIISTKVGEFYTLSTISELQAEIAKLDEE